MARWYQFLEDLAVFCDKPLISLVSILKDESKSVRQLIQSVAPAVDRVDLLDTQSSDDTVKIARETCEELGLPCCIRVAPFLDFASTRNAAMEFAEPNAQFALQLSGDEILVNAEAVREFCASPPPFNAFWMWTESDQKIFRSSRLVRLGKGWHWVRPVHEYLTHPSEVFGPDVPDAKIVHSESDPERKRRRFYRDLEALHTAHRKDPKDARTLFYLAQTFECLGFHSEAARWYFLRAANHDGWEEERYMAMYRGALCILHARLDINEAEKILLDAASVRPWRAEAWTALAELMLQQKRFATAYMFAQRASELPIPTQDSLCIEPNAYDWRPVRVMSFCAIHIGDYQAGIDTTLKMLERHPGDETYQKNLEVYRAKLK